MPLYRFHIDSPISPGEAMRRLQPLVRPQPGLGESMLSWFGPRANDDVPFVGRIEAHEFRIHRHIRYRNSFLPQIRGAVDATPTGTRVSVTMHLHPMVALFIAGWLSFAGRFALSALAQWGTGHVQVQPLVMLAFGIALTLGGFYPEARKARTLLERALTATGKTG
jgi:hypothetical protein